MIAGQSSSPSGRPIYSSASAGENFPSPPVVGRVPRPGVTAGRVRWIRIIFPVRDREKLVDGNFTWVCCAELWAIYRSLLAGLFRDRSRRRPIMICAEVIGLLGRLAPTTL